MIKYGLKISEIIDILAWLGYLMDLDSIEIRPVGADQIGVHVHGRLIFYYITSRASKPARANKVVVVRGNSPTMYTLDEVLKECEKMK